MMKALRIMGVGRAELLEEPLPVLKADEVLVKVMASGICGTDYTIYTGVFSGVQNGRVKFPLRIGHEWSGVVESVGTDVARFAPKDRVVGDGSFGCGKCEACITGNIMACPGFRAVGTVNAWDGALSEYVVFPERALIHLPDGVGFTLGALAEPVANALNAVQDARVSPHDNVLILGTGPIGMASVLLARLFGAKRVVTVGRSDKKLSLCKELGATNCIHTGKEDLLAAIDDLGCIDAAIEFSGNPQLFYAAVRALTPGGRLSIGALYEKPFPIDLDALVFKNITVTTVPGGSGAMRPVLSLMNSGRLNELESIVTDRYTLEEAAEALRLLKTNNENRVKAMVFCHGECK